MRYLIILISFLFVNHSLFSQEVANDSLESIDLIFAGDVMGHGPQISAAQVVKDKEYDYTPCFKYVQPIIQKADLAIGNLEVTLPGKPPYQGYPRFRSPDELAIALRLAGFDLLVTSNNHSNDAGKTGVVNTINTLSDYGFYQTGTFANAIEKEIFYPLIIYKNNFKLAFLNYTYGTNGLPTKAPTIVNLIDTIAIKKDLEIAKKLQPDAIIVIMHWGKEYRLEESSDQNELTQQLFDWGADLIIGAHPHVVQPIKEQINEEGEKEVVVYSMGNFISNQTKTNTDGGILFEIRLLKNKKNGKVILGEHHYIPVWRYIHKEKGKRTYYAVPVSAFENGQEDLLNMTATNKAAMKKFAKNTRNHLSKYDGKERKIDVDALNLSDN